MSKLTLRLLGGFEAEVDGSPRPQIASDKERALLAYVLLHAGTPVPRQRLAALLWPEQPQDKALHSCRQALSSLRRLLHDDGTAEPVLIVSHSHVQANRAGGYVLDVDGFRDSLALATRGWGGRESGGRLDVRALRRAVALYRGPLLDGLNLADAAPFDDWLLPERESLARATVQALGLLAEYHERRGELAAAMGIAERIAQLVPWDEEAHYLAMRLAAADGQWAAALAQYRTCVVALRSLMDAEPSERMDALLEEVRLAVGSGKPTSQTLRSGSANLPPDPTPFVGREREMDDLARLLADPGCRLLTLVGPGGVGKTRLALSAAREQLGLFRDGVYFVALADIDSTQPLAPSIAAAIGLSFSDRTAPEQQLLDYLRRRQLLLVLDNLEHLPAAAPMIASVLSEAPGAAVIATSRERLNLREEWAYPVSGLACPDATGGGDVGHYGASDLFLSASRRADARFTPSGDEQAAIARICRALDGLPLGLELAAGMLRHATCEEIAADLEYDVRSLAGLAANTPERHRSLRATFAHSWQLLAPEEREVFRQLSVFRGAVDREAAVVVTGATPNLLATLADKSLLLREGPSRYRAHELLRQFGAEQLASDPTALAEVRARHAEYYAELLAGTEASERARGPALAFVGQHIGDARQAWAYMVEARRFDLIRSVMPALVAFHESRGLFIEGADLLDEAVAASGDQTDLHARLVAQEALLCLRAGQARRASDCLQRLDTSLALLAEAERALYHRARAFLALHLGEHRRAEEHARMGQADANVAGDPETRAACLYVSGVVAYRGARPQQARTLLEEGLRLARFAGSDRLCVSALNMIGDVTCHAGDYTAALDVFAEALDLCQELGDEAHSAVILNSIGTVHHVLGDLSVAAEYYERSLSIVRAFGDRAGQGLALSNLGELVRSGGDLARAGKLFREGVRLAQEAGGTWVELCCLDNLAATALAQGEVAESTAHFLRAFETARRTGTLTMVPRLLVHAAPLLVRAGDEHLAAAALGHASSHPASEAYTRREAETLLSELGATPAVPETPLEDVLDAIIARLR